MPLSSAIRSFVVVLSAVGYATAQVPLGVQMIPNPEMSGNSDPAPPSSSYSDSSSYSVPNLEMSGYSDPAPSYPGYSGSSSYSVPPVETGSPPYGAPPSQYTSPPAETGSPSYGAPPSQYTPPPAESSGSYEPMPYSSFTNGGYSQMDCGYGYKKGYDGKCTPESWVRLLSFLFPGTRLGNKPTECCAVFADRAYVFFLF